MWQGVVIHKGPGLVNLQVRHAVGGGSHREHLGRRAGNEDQEHPDKVGLGRPVLLGDLMFAVASLAVDQGDSLGLGRGAAPTAEPTRHPAQARLGQILVRPVQSPPPASQPAPVLAHGEVGVEHDTIHTVVRAIEQVRVIVREVIFLLHGLLQVFKSRRMLYSPEPFRCNCPRRGPLFRSEVCEKA